MNFHKIRLFGSWARKFRSGTPRPRISVVIPALNEGRNIASVIRVAKATPGVAEVLVVDDGSIDDTRACSLREGARVITSSLLGKGASMDDGLRHSRGDILVYLDGDLQGLDPGFISKLVEPLENGRADFAKACFSRSAGRVTTLTAKPLIETFFPELAHFAQPLGGIIAVRREALERLSFETDYGVDLALLIDAHFLGLRLEEVDIGHLEHDSQSLEALGDMARQVVRALLHRAAMHGRLSLSQVQEVEERERHVKGDCSLVLSRISGAERLALIDMDGTLLQDRTILEIGRRTGRLAQIEAFLDRPDLSPEARTEGIAACLAGVPKSVFLEVARTMQLTKGAQEMVVELRRQGYRVGIVSDSFHAVTEIVRRRVFADFSIANLLRFRDGAATGEISLAPIFKHPSGCAEHEVCKWNVLLHLEEKLGIPAERVLAVGDSGNDTCLLRHAGMSVAFEPKSVEVGAAAAYTVRGDLRGVLAHAARAATPPSSSRPSSYRPRQVHAPPRVDLEPSAVGLQ